jgi:hypothetical protein
MCVAGSARHWIEAAARPALLCLTVLAMGPGALCSASTVPAQFRGVWFQSAPKTALAGTYQGHAPAADAAKRVFILRLAPDGTALLTIMYIGRHDATEPGRWSQTGAEVVLTFDPLGGNQPPRPITFHYHHEALHPIHWDLSEWGRAGPPVLYRRSHGATAAPS